MLDIKIKETYRQRQREHFRRGRHSAKPPEVRDMIATWFPNARRLEMFAREQAEGWTVWGNEVEAN